MGCRYSKSNTQNTPTSQSSQIFDFEEEPSNGSSRSSTPPLDSDSRIETKSDSSYGSRSMAKVL